MSATRATDVHRVSGRVPGRCRTLSHPPPPPPPPPPMAPLPPSVQVIDGVLRVSAAIYDVAFRPCLAPPTLWHPSVECHEMLGAGGALRGRFYLDMHPRADKFSHAAAYPIHRGARGREIPEVCLVCNVPDPAKGSGFLAFRDVSTVFHEFGHLLHFLFAGQGRWERFAGFTIDADFREAPAIVFQYWVYSWEILRCSPPSVLVRPVVRSVRTDQG